MKKTWEGIKSIITPNNNKSQLPNCLKKGGHNLTDPTDNSERV